MPDILKIPGTSSTHGRGIKVTQTAIATGDTIHTAKATTVDGEGDVVKLSAFNSTTTTETVVIAWGGLTDPDDLFEYKLPAGERHVICEGMFLRNALVVKAASTTADVVVIWPEVLEAG